MSFTFATKMVSLILVASLVVSGCSRQLPFEQEPVACTLDAKICPDGSTVGRTGPKCEFAPCPALSPLPDDYQMEEANIKVTTPTANQEVSFPLTVNGEARVFENVLEVELSDAEGKVLAKRTVQAQSPDVGQFGPFTASFTKTTTVPTQVRAFNYSAKDGSEENVVVVPIVVTSAIPLPAATAQ